VNLIVPETVFRLREVVKELSEDEKVQVVIFTSGIAHLFYNHFDLTRVAEFPIGSEANAIPVWTDLVLRLSKASFVSIAHPWTYKRGRQRTIADAELDSFIDTMASRLASFDKTALAAAKAQINRATLPPDADIRAAYTEFVASLSFPGFNARSVSFVKLLTDLGIHDIEKRLGYYLGIANKYL